MSVGDRIEALKAKHQNLENALQEEASRLNPDETRIVDIKKQKLRIKDEIAAIQHH